MVPGQQVNLGDEDYVLPPINLLQVKELKEQRKRVQSIDINTAFDEDRLDAAVDIIHAALKRNYPDLPREKIEENLNLRSIWKFLGYAMGPTDEKKSEASSAGEAAAAPIATTT